VRRTIAAALAWACCLGAAAAEGDPVAVLRATELRSDKRPDAPPLRTLATGASVSVLAIEGGWARVETQGAPRQRGWLRAGTLNLATTASAASRLRSGREDSTEATVTLGVRGGSEPRWHALLVLLGRYGDPSLPALAGSAADEASALQIADTLDVAPADLRVLRNADATVEGMTSALAQMAAGMGRGDGLLLYFSGHGTRAPHAHGAACTEALLAYDGRALHGADVARMLAPATTHRNAILALYDASFTAPTARSPLALQAAGVRLPTDEGLLRPRFARTGIDCASRPEATSFLAAVAATAGKRDQVQVAPSAAGVALDDAHKGGLLTQFFRDCLLRDARPAAGPVLAAAAADCTNEKIAARAAGLVGNTAANVVLAGDGALALEKRSDSGQLR